MTSHRKKISIIISNRNDVSMLAVTVRSCLEELKPFGSHGEVVICDNSDRDTYSQVQKVLSTKYLESGLLKLLRQDFPCLFTAREQAVRSAEGEYILCLDSHMLLGKDLILDSVDFMDRHSGDPSLAFAHPPISWAHMHESQSRHDRDMTSCELGNWGAAYKYEHKMTWKGMPWICRRDFFLGPLGAYGALSRHRLSWGGGDMHIGLKPWLLGYENWAIPCNPGIHLGPFPTDHGFTTYRLYRDSGQYPPCLGFLVSCYVLGDEAMMERNHQGLQRRYSHLDTRQWWATAKRLGEEERRCLRRVQVTSFENLLLTRPWDDCSHNSKHPVCAVAGAR